jgi:cell division protein FtsB
MHPVVYHVQVNVMALLPPIPAKYKGRFALCAAAVVGLAVVAVFGDHGLKHLVELRQAQAQLEETVFRLQQQNEQLSRNLHRIQSDDLYLEKLARERLGLVKQGEIVYREPVPQRNAP